MTSDIQLEANRTNAQKSTGPTTESGKAAVRFNATRHGLTGHVACMTWEDRDAFNQFCAAIVADLQPEGAIETQLAQSIAEDHWRLNRARAIEENLFALGSLESTLKVTSDDPQVHAALAQAETFRNEQKTFNLITLYESRIHRNLHRNMDALAHLQANRRVAGVSGHAQLSALNAMNRANREEAVRGRNGFVFSDAEIARAERGRETSSTLAPATFLTSGPRKILKSIRALTYREAA